MYSNPVKITHKIAKLWADIIKNTKDSRLNLVLGEAGDDFSISMYTRVLEDSGVPLDRVDIQNKMPLKEYFDAYRKVDIMFDTYPYNGGMTTCDALWMGVPVVSLVGEHHFSRVGLSLLSAVGLDYFACKDEDEYVAKATVLASKPDTLNKIRFQLRQRMLASDMCNPQKQAKNMEDAYRQMWRKWCIEQQN